MDQSVSLPFEEILCFLSIFHNPYQDRWGSRTSSTNLGGVHTWTRPNEPHHCQGWSAGLDIEGGRCLRQHEHGWSFLHRIHLDFQVGEQYPLPPQICSATSLFLKRSGMSCTCTQNKTLVMSEELTTVKLSYLDSTMICLSKLQGLVARILSTSSLELKEKRIRWSLMNFILKPNLDLHRGLKVLAMDSRLIWRFVRKRAIMENSVVAWSDFRAKPENSFSDSERDFQWVDRSSIL